MIEVDVIENGREGHDDLLFSIPGLIEKQIFDTYYFFWAFNPQSKVTLSETQQRVARLLCYWEEKVQESQEGDIIYLPVDFSDEWTGCVRMIARDKALVLAYGRSSREGYSVDPLNPQDYYKNVADFRAITQNELVCSKKSVLLSLSQQINKLEAKH